MQRFSARRFTFPLLLVTAAFAGGDPPLKDWTQGPIRYLAERDEVKAFRTLATDDERMLFIERFWERRDPSPGTLTNEYRQLFWERVLQANADFRDSSKPGWLTDRGKIFILYGPPTDIQNEPDLATEGEAAAGRGLIRWTYQGRPGNRMDLNPIVVVPFVRDAAGEYRLSYDPRLASVFFDALAMRDRRTDRFPGMRAPSRSSLSVMLDLGRMQEVPPQEQVLLDRVLSTASFRTHPLAVAIERYRHRSQPGTLVVLTVDLGAFASGDEPALLARFTPRDAGRAPRLLGEGSFRTSEHDGRRLAQGRVLLEPGEYDLMLIAAHPQSAVTGMFRGTVEAGDPSTALTFSDLVWAHAIEPVPYASLSSYDEPFHVGPFRVIPKLDDAYARGEVVKLFYEIYGTATPFRVTYQLEGKEADGRFVPLGPPQTAEQTDSSQAWELATTDRWPVGEYRVRVGVVDAKSQAIETYKSFALGSGGPAR